MTGVDQGEALAALAARVEAATESSRGLDEAIALALGWRPYEFYGEDDYRESGWHSPDNPLPHSTLPRWTGSLDAAVSLVPIGQMNLVDLTLSWEPSEPNVHPAVSVRWYPPHKEGPDWHGMVTSAATPALALCAAALRALREHIQSKEGDARG